MVVNTTTTEISNKHGGDVIQFSCSFNVKCVQMKSAACDSLLSDWIDFLCFFSAGILKFFSIYSVDMETA